MKSVIDKLTLCHSVNDDFWVAVSMIIAIPFTQNRRLVFLCRFSKVAFAGAVLPPRRFRHRGPPRFLGRTKAQYLDLLMRTNTRLSAFVTFIAVPALMIWSYRYITVLKPAKDAAKQKVGWRWAMWALI